MPRIALLLGLARPARRLRRRTRRRRGRGRDNDGCRHRRGAATFRPDRGGRVEHGRPAHRRRRRRSSRRATPASRSRSASPAPAAASRVLPGETDISDASRPIKDEEADGLQEGGIDYVEFQVANDALTVVVNKDNDWVDCLTVDQLEEDLGARTRRSTTGRTSIRRFPDEKMKLFGPGTDSGTFDYFTGEINGEEGASRTDYTATRTTT